MSSNKNYLNIYLQQNIIAELHIQNDQLSWQYSDAWQQHGFPVSPNLPLRITSYRNIQVNL